MSGTILAVASGKGGVGKTWLAITLAHLIARTGRKTLLFDGDIGLANVDVQLGLTPAHDLSEVFYSDAALAEIITCYAPNFDIIAGRSGSGNLASLPAAKLLLLREQLTALTATYDTILIDLGAGVEEHVRTLAGIASRLVIVVTDEPTSLTDAYAFIKLCLASGMKISVEIVVNQALSLKEGQKTYGLIHKACASFLNISPALLGVIRKDGKVRDAIRSQTSLISRSPTCTAATDSAAIAIKLMQK